MKLMSQKIIFLFLIVHCTLVIPSTRDCFAQWQPDVRLTNDPAFSYISSNNAWCIASSGNSVHVVWYDNRDGNPEIYYKRSTDGGISWSADTRLTNNAADSYYPSVAVSAQAPALAVHVVWVDERDGNSEIYYKRSADGGLSWGADTRLTNNTATSFHPSVTVSGSVVHVVWNDNRNGKPEIYYKRSTDGGINWGADTRLTNNFANSLCPSVAVSAQAPALAVYVTFVDERNGNSQIYYKRSTDGGISWGADTRLTNNNFNSGISSVAVSGQAPALAVHVVWYDLRDGNWEIYYKRSTDAGINWGTDTRLTNNTAVSWAPSVALSGSAVHVVWYDNRDGNEEIYYKRSTDGGISWSADTRLTNNAADSYYPSVAVSGSAVHIVWRDNRDGNVEIYYKRDPTGNPIGITNIGSEIPKEFSLSQNYPNPFNPSTKIRFAISGTLVAQTFLSVYDILGREVATLVNEQLQAGKYEVEFDAANYPSGVYFYRIAIHSDKLITVDYSETKRMTLIK